VNHAARLMDLGHGGQVLCSAVTAALVGSGPAATDGAFAGRAYTRSERNPSKSLRPSGRPVRKGAGTAGRPPPGQRLPAGAARRSRPAVAREAHLSP
jgi:hypothetical protein